jgi:lipopolysaccharide export system protein LptC
MARDEPGAGAPSAGFEDDDVDLSFAGPEPVAAAPWPLRFLDVVSAYLPLLLMAMLALGTWWLVRNAPEVEGPTVPVAPRHVADYTMTRFVVQRFASDGALRTQIEGERLRHFPDNDTFEIDEARIRSFGTDGVVTIANAKRALANGDGSELQLFGEAQVLRPAHGKNEAVEFRSEFLHAFRNVERVRSHVPVVVTQGQTVVRASQGMEYDNLSRVVDLKGRTSATFVAAPRSARR